MKRQNIKKANDICNRMYSLEKDIKTLMETDFSVTLNLQCNSNLDNRNIFIPNLNDYLKAQILLHHQMEFQKLDKELKTL